MERFDEHTLSLFGVDAGRCVSHHEIDPPATTCSTQQAHEPNPHRRGDRLIGDQVAARPAHKGDKVGL